MKLIKPYYQILTPINGEEILKQIELAARTCYQSEDKIEYITKHSYDNKTETYLTSDEVIHLNRATVFGFYAKSARILIPKLMNLNHEAML